MGEIKNSSFMSVIPNPLTHNVELFLNPAKSFEHAHLRIVDALGRTAADEYFSRQRLVLQKDLLKSGVYFYSLMDDRRVIFTDKLIVE